MNLDTELREALRAQTSDVVLPPDLLPDVHRSGRRRRLRTRLVLAATPVAVAGVVVAGLVVAPRQAYTAPTPDQVAAALTTRDRALLAGPTQGDLAGDGAYLTAAAGAWRDGHGASGNADRGIFDHPVGEPVVIWAGTTPAGNAAVVGQVFDLRAHDDVQLDREGPAMLWGFVGPGKDGSPVVVADGYPVPGAPDAEGAFIGRDRQVLLVLDRGTKAEVSWAGLTYRDDGTAARTWTPLTFSGGVAVAVRPANADPAGVRLRLRGDYADIGNGVLQQEAPPDRRLPWAGHLPAVWPVGSGAAAWNGTLPDSDAAGAALDAGLTGAVPSGWPDINLTAYSFWFAAGTTPDGRRLIAGERQFDGDPSRVYVVVGTGRTVQRASRPVGAAADAVPVLVPLPGGQGWLVAKRGAQLSWRTGSGPWTVAGTDAALLPAAATEVRAGGVAVTLR